MSRQHRNMKSDSPYSAAPNNQPTYPSQSADYNSFYMGGQAAPPSEGNWRQRNQFRGGFNSMQRNNNNYNNNGSSTNNYFYSTNGNVEKCPAQNNTNSTVPYFYQNHAPAEPCYNNRQNNYHNNKSFGGSIHNNNRRHQRHNLNSENADISDYFHPSMLEDPWHDLMKRHLAIEECDLKLHIGGSKDDHDDSEHNAKSSKEIASEDRV